MITVFHAAAWILYAVVAAALYRALARDAPPPRSAALLAIFAVVVHAAALALFIARYGEPPLVGLAPSLTMIAWLIALFLTTFLTRREGRPLGLVLLPIILILLAVALLHGIRPEGEPSAFRGAWLAVHVLAAFVGYAGLAIAFAAGLLYLLQFRQLRERRIGRVLDFLPSLETLDRLGARSLAIGFTALTLGLLVGWAWTLRFRHTLAASDPQVIWGTLTWAIFGVALLARRGGASRDRRGAVVSVVGFVLVVVAYLVLRLSSGRGGGFL